MKRLAAAAAITLALASCSGSGTAPAGSAVPHREGGISTQLGVNTLAACSNAAVIGTVVSVGKPYTWTEDDRSGGEGNSSYPVTYADQDVTIAVDTVVWNGPAGAHCTNGGAPLQPKVPPLAAGDLITVAVQPATEGYRTLCGHDLTAEQTMGDLAVGRRVLMILNRIDGAVGPNGSRSVWRAPLTPWEATWAVDGGRAVSASPERSAPLQALLDRLVRERSADWVGDHNEGTQENPLAAAARGKSPQQGCAEHQPPPSR